MGQLFDSSHCLSLRFTSSHLFKDGVFLSFTAVPHFSTFMCHFGTPGSWIMYVLSPPIILLLQAIIDSAIRP